MEIVEITGASGFNAGLEEIMVKLEDQTNLEEPGVTTPVFIGIYSDGRIDDNGKRIVDVRAYVDATPAEIGDSLLAENQAV